MSSLTSESSRSRPPTLPSPPVVLADPDDATRAHLRHLLRCAGYPVLEAPDGRTAAGTLSTTRVPMILLLALGLPDFEEVLLLASATQTTGVLPHHAVVVVTDGPQVLPPLAVALRLSQAKGVQLSKPLDDARVLEVLASLRQRLASRTQP